MPPSGPLPQSRQKTIGWRESVSFPDWGVRNLLAKADTGAKGSAIDVESYEIRDDNTVCFHIARSRNNRDELQTIIAPILGMTRVRSSNGRVQTRVRVETVLKIGRVKKRISLTLVNRDRMICRVLLGRDALANSFIVDSSEKYIHGPRKTASFHPVHHAHRTRG